MFVETERLRLRPFTLEDTAFIVELLNQPSFIENIGDRGVRNLDDAARYLESGPLAMYQRVGYGLCAVVLKETGALIGMCGVLKRDSLEFPDLGFAFLPAFWSSGYAREAAAATMRYARDTLGLSRIDAITALENRPSMRLLEKIGFRFEHIIELPGYAGGTRLFISEP